MIKIKANIKLSLDNQFAVIPQLGKTETWKSVEEIKIHDVCWLRAKSKTPLIFGLTQAILVTSNPVIKDDYVEFDFTEFYMP